MTTTDKNDILSVLPKKIWAEKGEKMKKQRTKFKIKLTMHRLPLQILKLFLPIILVMLAYVAIYIVRQADGGRNMIDIGYIAEMLTYIIISFTILVCGSILFDIAIKKIKE